MDAVSTARVQELYPALGSKIARLIAQLESEGIECRVVQGLRSWTQQDALYAQGRTAPGPIVTNVPGGCSYHNFGLAADVVPSQFAPGQPYDPDWNAAHPAWTRMIQLGESLDLVSGSSWRTFPDYPHFQYTGRFPEPGPDDEVRQIFTDGGTQAVWDEVSKSVS